MFKYVTLSLKIVFAHSDRTHLLLRTPTDNVDARARSAKTQWESHKLSAELCKQIAKSHKEIAEEDELYLLAAIFVISFPGFCDDNLPPPAPVHRQPPQQRQQLNCRLRVSISIKIVQPSTFSASAKTETPFRSI